VVKEGGFGVNSSRSSSNAANEMWRPLESFAVTSYHFDDECDEEHAVTGSKLSRERNSSGEKRVIIKCP
jgi:hypothetical protein